MTRQEEFETLFHERTDADTLGNLLAILNGDGGHYQSDHGTAKAAARGAERFYQQIEAIDKAAFRLKQHLDNAAGDSSWVMEALEILEEKK